MKYIVLIGDGMADRPLAELQGKTPLEAACTPNLDFIATRGVAGFVRTVPRGLTAGSDVANMSVFGYDPKKYYSGRGPLEAASLGVELKKDEFAFRCNLVNIRDGVMQDFTAGHISTKEASELLRDFSAYIKGSRVKFIPGISYRHLAIIKGGFDKTVCTAPHDITDRPVRDYLPKGPNAKILNDLMQASEPVFLSHSINQTRIKNQQAPATGIWLWGQGKKSKMPRFEKIYHKSGAVITAVHLLKGIGQIVGLQVIDVPGATGFVDTNYAGKAEAAMTALKTHDMVFLHVEAPDECGHMGDIKLKIKAIEDFDRQVAGYILREGKKLDEFGVMVLPDHPTPIELKTHSADPVPFAMYKTRFEGRCKMPEAAEVKAYNEKEVARSGFMVKNGPALLQLFFEI